jgi:cytoskeletal protein CcmA (bactofilin family)
MNQKASVIENPAAVPGAADQPGASREDEKNLLRKEGVVTEGRFGDRSGDSARRSVTEINAINKGSKVTGNFVITQDLEVTGDIEGNITGENNSSIFIKGTCKGNVKTAGGSVEIEGDMSGGDIVAGGSVKVTGKFHGGKIQAGERIHINGEFSGSLESKVIEIGAAARGKGELFYRETLCIEKGAKVEGSIARVEAELKPAPAPKPAAAPVVRKEEVKPKKGFFS